MTEYLEALGKHLRALRRARGLTQDQVARRSRLSPDTVRRLESGKLSPRVDTLRRLAGGLGISLATLFESLEVGNEDPRHELVDLLRGRSELEIRAVVEVARALSGVLREWGHDQPNP